MILKKWTKWHHSSNSHKAEAGDQTDLQNEYQASLYYVSRHCLKIENEEKINYSE